MAAQEPGQQTLLTALPRLEDLPKSGDGYDPDKVTGFAFGLGSLHVLSPLPAFGGHGDDARHQVLPVRAHRE